MHILRNRAAIQARGALICVHVGSTAIMIGSREKRGENYWYAHRVELLTPFHWFRFRRGKWAR